MHEVITNIKRTVWISQCPECTDRVVKTESAPRERLCMNCNLWVPFKEESYTGPDLKK